MLDFSYCIVQRKLTEEIGMQCEYWVQKLLSTEEGEQYVSESWQFPCMLQEGRLPIFRMGSANSEIWLIYYDMETKQQSCKWNYLISTT